MQIFLGIFCVVVSYLVGSVNTAYLLGRSKGEDIREKGSGNAGGSNTLIVYGAKAGVFVMLFDILKAFMVTRISYLITKSLFIAIMSAAAVIMGHMFPVFFNFKGGKGLACYGGSILALTPKWFVLLLAGAVIFLLFIDYIALVTLGVSVLFPAICYYETGSGMGSMLLLCLAAVIFIKHRENLSRMLNGTEAHCFKFLRQKDEELARIRRNE